MTSAVPGGSRSNTELIVRVLRKDRLLVKHAKRIAVLLIGLFPELAVCGPSMSSDQSNKILLLLGCTAIAFATAGYFLGAHAKRRALVKVTFLWILGLALLPTLFRLMLPIEALAVLPFVIGFLIAAAITKLGNARRDTPGKGW